MVAGAVEKLGGLDVLVTVVGGQVAFVPAVKLHEMADEDWDTIYEVNLRYVARAVRAVLRVFLAQGGGGTIVSVGSVTGFMAAPKQAAYGVMKAGLLSLARTVAAEYARDGIRMNVAAAGAIATAVANASRRRRGGRGDPGRPLRPLRGGRRRGRLPRLGRVLVHDRPADRPRRRGLRPRSVRLRITTVEELLEEFGSGRSRKSLPGGGQIAIGA